MIKRRILILDCTPHDEPSEGRLLKEFFQICRLYKPAKASSLYYKINSKKSFLSKLNTGKRYDVIHVSAHGPPEGEVGLGNGRTWMAKPKDIETTNHKAILVFANACLASKQVIANAFKGACRIPMKTVLHLSTQLPFWLPENIWRYIVDGISMRSAFEYARKRTQTSGDYPNFWE